MHRRKEKTLRSQLHYLLEDLSNFLTSNRFCGVGILEGFPEADREFGRGVGLIGVWTVSDRSEHTDWISEMSKSEASLPRRLLALLPALLPARLPGLLDVFLVSARQDERHPWLVEQSKRRLLLKRAFSHTVLELCLTQGKCNWHLLLFTAFQAETTHLNCNKIYIAVKKRVTDWRLRERQNLSTSASGMHPSRCPIPANPTLTCKMCSGSCSCCWN